MPIHLSTLAKLKIAVHHVRVKLFPGRDTPESVRESPLSARLEVALVQHYMARGHRVPMVTYLHWADTFRAMPACLDPRIWESEFRSGADLDWIVRQAFQNNPGLEIDLIFDDARHHHLKFVEAKIGRQRHTLWSA